MRTHLLAASAVCLALLPGCEARPDYSGAELYSGFILADPETQTLRPDSWLVVRGGRIEETGAGPAPAGDFAAVHEVAGLYAIPGLIDAHAHIIAGPQRVTIVDGAPRLDIVSHDEYSRGNGAAALASGITSVRNPGGSLQAAARYDAMVGAGEWLGPTARHAGRVHQPLPFAGESFAHPKTPEEWDADAAAEAAAGMTYYKLYTDLTEEEVAQGVAAAERHGLIPIAHLNAVSWTRAAELGVRQFEHALPTSPDLLEPGARAEYAPGADFMTRWWELAELDGPVMQEMIDTLTARGVTVDLTLMVNEMIYFADQLAAIFPEMAGDLPDYMHPDFAAMAANYEAMAAAPAEQIARGHAVWPKVLDFARLLHDSGVNLMIGTDGTGGGPAYPRELHNHVLAGIPAWEVLRMATSGNADLIGLPDTGRIAPGKEADLVFLRADPVADVRNVSQTALVVNDGVAYEPEALLDIARGIATEARARIAAQPAPAAAQPAQ